MSLLRKIKIKQGLSMLMYDIEMMHDCKGKQKTKRP